MSPWNPVTHVLGDLCDVGKKRPFFIIYRHFFGDFNRFYGILAILPSLGKIGDCLSPPFSFERQTAIAH